MPKDESILCRKLYLRTIPQFLNIGGAQDRIYSFSGTFISDGYERIVVGDYGAFVEFTEKQAKRENFVVKPGEEYRFSERYIDTIKYLWLTTNDFSETKIYHQKKTVSYADYKPGYFYVSVFEVTIHGDVKVSTGF